MRIKRFVIATSLGLGLTLALLGLLGGQLPPAHADSPHYVAPGANCNGATPCHASVQEAVDAAVPGDEIRVAAGDYTGVQARGGITQVVYISKTLTIRGGYTIANWTMPNPSANPTTLDAQGLGRVLVISGTITPTVEGLRLTGGDATGLGGASLGRDGGGGVYVYTATATISGCIIYSNTASTANTGYGGGLYLWYSAATLSGNTVQGNTASPAGADGRGGGLYVELSAPTIESNTVQDNAAVAGGGLYVYTSTGVISRNLIIGNHASWWGGGMYLEGVSPLMEGNVVMSNTATGLGGFAGGGLILNVGAGIRVTLTNHIIAHNAAGAGGHTDGVHCMSGSCALIHCTIADNNEEGVRLSAGDGVNVVWNSIIAGHSVGITVPVGYTATLDYNDYYENDSDVGGGGAGATWGTHHRIDDPQFEDRAGGDYHLNSNSPLIDAGDNSLGVLVDFEGDPRPVDGDGNDTATVDIGADEFTWRRIYLPLVLRNYP